jgi:fructose-bisphosphate aldolase class II
MNVDTDTQYAFTRPVAGWMFANYDGVLKIDGEVGNKKKYDPRAWGKEAEAGMAARVVEACQRASPLSGIRDAWLRRAGPRSAWRGDRLNSS